jgi:hypothetical protein
MPFEQEKDDQENTGYKPKSAPRRLTRRQALEGLATLGGAAVAGALGERFLGITSRLARLYYSATYSYYSESFSEQSMHSLSDDPEFEFIQYALSRSDTGSLDLRSPRLTTHIDQVGTLKGTFYVVTIPLELTQIMRPFNTFSIKVGALGHEGLTGDRTYQAEQLNMLLNGARDQGDSLRVYIHGGALDSTPGINVFKMEPIEQISKPFLLYSFTTEITDSVMQHTTYGSFQPSDYSIPSLNVSLTKK